MLKVTFVSYCDHIERLLIWQVKEAFPAASVVKPIPMGRTDPNRLRTKKPVRQTHGLVEWVGTKARAAEQRAGMVYRRGMKKLARSFPIPKPIDDAYPIPRIDVNGERGIAQLHALSPDVLIAFGAPILRPEVLRIPRLCALNVHMGIAPDLRGNDCLFWSLYNADFDHTGATIHKMSERLDGGDILAYVYPELASDDTEASLEAKTVRAAASVLVDFLQELEQDASLVRTGKKQTPGGRLYRAGDRRLATDLAYWGRRALGIARPPRREERIVRFFSRDSTSLRLTPDDEPERQDVRSAVQVGNEGASRSCPK